MVDDVCRSELEYTQKLAQPHKPKTRAKTDTTDNFKPENWKNWTMSYPLIQLSQITGLLPKTSLYLK